MSPDRVYVWFLESKFRTKGRNALFLSIYGAAKKAFLSISTCEELKKKEPTESNE